MSAGVVDLDTATYSRLLVGGDRLVRLDVDKTSARDLPIPGLAADRYVSSLVSRRGATVVLVSRRSEPARRPGTAWVVPDSGKAPVALGPADQVLPAVAPDRVWLVTSESGRQGSRRLMRLLDIRGRALAPPYTVRIEGRLVADVDGGFLVEGSSRGHPTLDLVDRRTARVHERVARQATVLAAGPHQLAWVDPSCRLRCSVHVKDLHTGFRLVVSILDVRRYGGAVSSPDARHLAFTAEAVITPGGPAVPVLLVAGVDEPGISAVALPAPTATSRNGVPLPSALTWSTNGAWVFLAAGSPQRLLAWRLGGQATAPVRFPITGVRAVSPD